jgi:UDP-N-acetylmuramoylalanine--D-glutamate ligase
VKNEWQGKSVLVLGLGDTGLSSVRWLAKRGARVRAADTRAAPPALGAVGAEFPGLELALGAFDEALLARVDAVVASPGLALREPLLRAALARGLEVVGDVEIFGREIAAHAKGPRVLGVTGTNGKSTVTALTAAMGRAAGLKAEAIGNIGVPVLDALLQAEARGMPDLFVVELSSYQLETTSSLALDAAAMLNVTQDHLDRYDSIADYARAKQRIFMNCGTRVVNRDDEWSRAMGKELGAGLRPGLRRGGDAGVFSFGLDAPLSESEWGLDAERRRLQRGATPLLEVSAMAMPGLHNVANGLAAHALASAIALPAEPLARALREFKGLPHRVQAVAEARGVRFYDDSKGTNVGASVAALEGFDVPVVLIAGGDGKGQDFSPLAPAVKGHARAVVLIGRDAPSIAAALAPTGVPVQLAQSMEEAVQAAFALAQHGDAVLLSPACASFDMFRNYEHRGEVFAKAAQALVGERGL